MTAASQIPRDQGRLFTWLMGTLGVKRAIEVGGVCVCVCVRARGESPMVRWWCVPLDRSVHRLLTAVDGTGAWIGSCRKAQLLLVFCVFVLVARECSSVVRASCAMTGPVHAGSPR